MTKNDVKNILLANDNFLILTHTRPDGDTIGSAAALCAALRRIGKNAFLYPNPEITDTYREFSDEFICEAIPENAFHLSVDTAAENMLPVGYEGKVRLAIDHHGSNSFYAENTYVESDKAACGQIIMDIIEDTCGSISLEEAELLYVAVSTDTGCFMYGNTNADALYAGAKLLGLGVNNGELNKKLFRSMSLSRLKLEGLIYSTMRSYRDNTINIAVITQDMMNEAGADENDCDDLASLAGKVKGSIVSVTIRELADGRSKASVRTTPAVNASDICAEYGGGGHSMAAGCTMNAGPWECADLMLKAVEKHYK